MIPPTAAGVAFLGRTGKAADQSEAFRQGRRAGGVLLQQDKASLDHLGLTETEGLAETVEPGLAAVIKAHGDGPHRSPWSVIRSYYRLILAHNTTAWPTISCRIRGCAVKAAAIRSRGAASRVLVRGQQVSCGPDAPVGQLIASGRGPEPGCPYPSQTVLMDEDQNTDDLVAQALAAIRSVLEPQHVVLYSCGEACGYGSRARRTHSAQSDLDLLIVAPSPFPDGLIHLAILLGVRTGRGNSLPESSGSSGEANQLLRAAEKDWRSPDP